MFTILGFFTSLFGGELHMNDYKWSTGLKPIVTSGGLGAVRGSQDFRQIILPRILHSRLKDLSVVLILQRPKVVPQVLDRLDMILLLRCKDGIKRLQLEETKEKKEIFI